MTRTTKDERQRTKDKRKKFLVLSFVLCPLSFLVGCGGRAPESVRLVLISPHREEIREEVGLAFKGWFQARTDDRALAAQAALQAEIKGSNADHRGAAESAFQELFHDWEPTDLPELWPAYQAWLQAPPSPGSARALLAALDQWRRQPHPADLVWLDVGGGTSAIARYVSARYETVPDGQGIGIDVLFGGGTDIYLRFAGQGLLDKVKISRPILARIPTDLNGVPLYDAEGRWYGAMLSSFGILYNRWVLERIGQPEPRRWEDLGRPELRTWVSAGDPRLSGSVHMVYEIILQGQGWEQGFRLLLRLGANTLSFIGDSGTLTRMVTNGEVATAGNVDANAFIALARQPDLIGYHLPEGETIINPDAIAVLRGAPHPGLARAFVEFVLSDAGQRLFLLLPGQPGGPRSHPLCRLSIVPELYDRYPPSECSVGDANPFAVHNVLPYNSQQGNRRWNALNDLLGAVIVDAHSELAAAWSAVLHSPLPEEQRRHLEEELFRPFCTEAELADHARRIVQDGPRARAETLNHWSEQARARYLRIRRSAN